MRRHAWLAALVTLAAIGCGTESGIFSEGGPSGSGGKDASGSGGSISSGSGGDGAGVTSSGMGGDTSTTGNGGAPSTTGNGGAPSTTGTGGETSTTTTGAGGNEPTLDCGGATTCATSNDGACCWDNYEFYGAPQGECVMGSTQSDGCQTSAQGEPLDPGAETRIECQTDAHCDAGTHCCGEIRQAFAGMQQITYYETVTCQQSCAQQGEVPLCDPNAVSPCAQGNCTQSQLLPLGYFVCVQ